MLGSVAKRLIWEISVKIKGLVADCNDFIVSDNFNRRLQRYEPVETLWDGN
jgi:hypothetical protein